MGEAPIAPGTITASCSRCAAPVWVPPDFQDVVVVCSLTPIHVCASCAGLSLLYEARLRQKAVHDAEGGPAVQSAGGSRRDCRVARRWRHRLTRAAPAWLNR